MGRRKGGLGGGMVAAILGGIVYAVAQYGKEILILVVIAIAIWIAVKIFGSKDQEPAPSRAERVPREPLPVANQLRGRGVVSGRITSTNPEEFWTGASGGSHGLGPWLYVGKGLGSVSGEGIEPALVDLRLAIDHSVPDCRVRRLEYWPTFWGATPDARGAFLLWLKSGRKDPSADIGYVFLYFYGLERRVLHDALSSDVAKADSEAIASEIQRLLSIYGTNNSFRNYAGSLLDILRNRSVPSALYSMPPPPLLAGKQLTFAHRLALAQCAADGRPLPAPWAYVWFRGDPATTLRMAAIRCPEEFRRLFELQYRVALGDGMTLPKNRTTLKMERRPASPTFGWGFSGHTLRFDLPDVTVLTSPVAKLAEIAESCYPKLDKYSRFIRRNEALAGTFDAIVELPFELWPGEIRKPVETVRSLVERAGKPIVIPFEKVQAWFPEWSVVNRQKMRSLYRALAEAGVGMEPDIRFGGGLPAEGSSVVLFSDDPASATASPSSRYSAAALTVQLASAVATSDGAASEAERYAITSRLEEWLHLSESERRRLHARIRYVLASPPRLTGLKSRLEALDGQQREAIGQFLALVAIADAEATPAEIATMEKTFRLLGLDPKSVYSLVHVATTEPVSVRPPADEPVHPIPRRPQAPQSVQFQLDRKKIDALQADSQRVAAILSEVFAQPPVEPEPQQVEEELDATSEPVATILDLDAALSGMVQVLITRVHWTRAELEDLAEDRGLMVDGALERINEASLDKYEKPLIEGEDPIEINQEVAREVVQ